jgi:hypothetical protein
LQNKPLKIKIMKTSKIIIAIVVLAIVICSYTYSQTIPIWARTTSSDISASIAHSDKDGNTYIVGHFKYIRDLDFSAGTYTLDAGTSSDGFISKYDAAGNFLWAYSFGALYNYAVEFLDFAIDDSSNIILVGRAQGIVDLDPSPGTYTVNAGGFNNWAMILAKFNKHGQILWGGVIDGGTQYTELYYGLVIDNSQNIYLNGVCYNCDLDIFSPVNAVSGGGLFLAKYDKNGNLLFKHNYVNSYGKSFLDINSSNQEIILASEFAASSDIDPSPTSSITIGSSSVTVVRYSSNGVYKNHFFITQAGGVNSQVKAVQVNSKGSIFQAIDFKGTIDLDPSPSTHTVASFYYNTLDFSVIIFDSTGMFKKAIVVGDVQGDVINSMVVNDSDFVYITGNFRYTGIFNPPSVLTNTFYVAQSSIYVAKYNDTLGCKFAFPIASSGYNSTGYVISSEKNGDMYLNCTISNGIYDFDPSVQTLTLTAGSSSGNVIAKYSHSATLPTGFYESNIYNSGFSVYPNPNNGNFTIQSEKSGEFELMDITGRIINTFIIKNEQKTIQENLPAGMYFIREKQSGALQKLIVN